jgi:hypothetical protein
MTTKLEMDAVRNRQMIVAAPKQIKTLRMRGFRSMKTTRCTKVILTSNNVASPIAETVQLDEGWVEKIT